MVTILTGKHLLKRTRSRKANYAGDHGILCSYIQIAQYYQEHGYFEEAFEYFKKAGKKGLTFGYTEFARANPEEGFEILKSIPLAFREATQSCFEIASLKLKEEEKQQFARDQEEKFKAHFTTLFNITELNY
jgi:hypothetical protein